MSRFEKSETSEKMSKREREDKEDVGGVEKRKKMDGELKVLPLHCAALTGHVGVAKFLIQIGADVKCC